MEQRPQTRRDVLTVGVAGATGVLAGCTSGGSDDPAEADESGAGTAATSGDDGRTVEMAPTGEVTFESVPENVANYFPGYADMAVALGHGDALNSVGVVDRYHTDHYAELDGVSVDKEGTNKKQFRDLGITDALSGTGVDGLSTDDRGRIDYETMLEVDPDSLLVRGHEDKSREEFEDTVVAFMENHETAADLTAVREGNVFRGGPIYVGPLQHLFLVERYATSYFSDTYSGELFDRSELSDIVTG